MFKSIVTATVIAIASISAQAKAITFLNLQAPGDKIVLHDKQNKCKEGFLYALVTWQGKPIDACWRFVNTPQGAGVYIIDAEGDEGILPAAAFKPIKDI